MAKTLIVTEKPSVGRDYAKILHVSGNKDGYIENDNYVITWSVGHLIQLSYPQAYDERLEKWNLEDLPFLPTKYKYETIKAVEKQYRTVKELLHRQDIGTVLWAGDSGREGQTIEEYIRMVSGVGNWMEEKRVWIDSCTEDEIKRGIRQAKPMSYYDDMSNAGIMRAIEDYAIGINFTRALTCVFKDIYSVAKDNALPVGRVLTCVVGMVVDRERAIRNFVETEYFRIFAVNNGLELEWKPDEDSTYYQSPKLYERNGFIEKKDADEFISKYADKEMKIISVLKKQERKNAPFLYNLAELQNDCSNILKLSPSQTLEIAQSLYMKKLTTYPRTDARVLSSAIADEIDINIEGLMKNTVLKPFAEEIMHNKSYEDIHQKKYVNDSMITDHYAIIPTGNVNDVGSLKKEEYDVYMLICKRFLSIFYPSAEFEKITLIGKIDGETFKTSATRLVKEGYMKVTGYVPKKDMEEKCKIMESLQENDTIQPSLEIRNGKTVPPKRYNTGSFILAMENAGQMIEDEELRQQIKGCGIGTSATRAEILAKAHKNKYIRIDDKTQLIYADYSGEICYEIVSSCLGELLNPKLTAEWEKGLEDIANGTEDKDNYNRKLEDYIRKNVENIKSTEIDENLKERIQVLSKLYQKQMQNAVCPLCKKPLNRASWGYYCTGYKDNTCTFRLSTEICGVKLKDAQIYKLLTKGSTDFLDGFKKKDSDETFSSALVSEIGKNESGLPIFTLKFARYKDTDLKCPKCGKVLIKTMKGYSCSGYKESGCDFGIYGTVAGKKLSERNIRDLIEHGKTDVIDGFQKKDKSGKFKARLKMIDYKLAFDFSEEETDLNCPKCGNRLLDGTNVLKCNCGFTVFKKIAGKSLTSKYLNELINKKKTSLIKGFVSKKGTKFDAYLYLDNEGKVNFQFQNVKN